MSPNGKTNEAIERHHMTKKNHAGRRREELNKKSEAHKKKMQPSGQSAYALKQKRRVEEAMAANREEQRLRQTSHRDMGQIGEGRRILYRRDCFSPYRADFFY